MSTPRKSFNYSSPYAKPVQQYPSQSEEFIAFNVGGQFQSGNNRNSGHFHYPNGSNRQQRRRNSNFVANVESHNHAGSHSAQKQWGTPRNAGGQYRNRFVIIQSNSISVEILTKLTRLFQQNKEKQEQVSISSYIHPSMTEDPWQKFMERIDAISKSRISLKSKPEKDDGSESTETEDEGVIETQVV